MIVDNLFNRHTTQLSAYDMWMCGDKAKTYFKFVNLATKEAADKSYGGRLELTLSFRQALENQEELLPIDDLNMFFPKMYKNGMTTWSIDQATHKVFTNRVLLRAIRTVLPTSLANRFPLSYDHGLALQRNKLGQSA
ncbi:hypothetical protein BCR42DRAFT_215727 [Absidia repens]|uniref:Uncharacterized protein n=1 Tax=Absidia repens TaxID=90262 RepID=A0A1X2HH57_9FUNG|nr:hypothetical protein BCR42DRAFT_215727 [Absidia repens]